MHEAEHMEASTRAKLQELTESSVYKLAVPALMSCAIFFLGYAVNRLSDHFDRIDAHLAASDTMTVVLRRDVDELKALVPIREAQIKEIRDKANETAWEVGELQRDQSRTRR